MHKCPFDYIKISTLNGCNFIMIVAKFSNFKTVRLISQILEQLLGNYHVISQL